MRRSYVSCLWLLRNGPEHSRLAAVILTVAFFVATVMALAVFPANAHCDGGSIAAENNDADAEFWASKRKPEKVSKGQQLFEQDFRNFKGFLSGGDGLGPMFNEVSCIACHRQGGIGGGGGLKHNVDILSFSERTPSPSTTILNMLHPGFIGSDGQFIPSLVLHRHSTDPTYGKGRASFFRKSWLKNQHDEEWLQDSIYRKPIREIEPLDNVYLLHSQRNTPALFGSGAIDQIPEELLHEVAAQEKRFGVAGRVSQVRGRRLGKFGWRAQLPDLEEFVLSACANELGLEVEGHSQARNPLVNERGLSRPEISKRDTDAMIKYVGELNSPTIDVSDQRRKSAVRGLRHFNEVGCAECHVRHMGPAQNVFSDFLLHDMGNGLSDPVAASREIEIVTRPNPEGTGQRSFIDEPKVVSMYYVGTVLVPQITTVPNTEDPYTDVFERVAETKRDPRQEWRTPPLWGCADSAPYLHDGRAPTLHEAIKKHGGESRRVRLNYLRLAKEEQLDLLTFLTCLRAPANR